MVKYLKRLKYQVSDLTLGWRMRWSRVLAVIGPGYLISLGYYDPGNWATDISAGAEAGMAMLWVILLSSIVGVFLQIMSLKIAYSTGSHLAELLRDQLSWWQWPPVWLATEGAMIATDIAELMGGAIAFYLLFDIPILVGMVMAGVVTMVTLTVPWAQGRFAERFLGLLVVMVVAGLLYEIIMVRPDVAEVVRGFIPQSETLQDKKFLYLSLGIIGATIMPHNLFLHTGLAAHRFGDSTGVKRQMLYRWLRRDTALSLALAFIVNAAILVVAAEAFKGHSLPGEVGIADAWGLIHSNLGPIAAAVFALSLLAAAQGATTTGTMAGQLVTEGFLRLRIKPFYRALVTRLMVLLPAILIPSLVSAETSNQLLVLTQVLLSLALPIIILPMLLMLRSRRLMGNGRISLTQFGFGLVVTVLLVVANAIWMLG
ncbi:MAG: Nramp family divalent metal transporter [Candidatus Pacebacteria bacterium]|nr:Nramp family divalent metal transporter [Candidatus Paceibacterota bacterium]